jgi:ferredoxin
MMPHRYLRSGQSLVLDEARCNGCGLCVEVCPHAVYTIASHRARIGRRESCMECGACRRNCAQGAIDVAAGVGCAAAVISQMRRGAKPGGASCGCN